MTFFRPGPFTATVILTALLSAAAVPATGGVGSSRPANRTDANRTQTMPKRTPGKRAASSTSDAALRARANRLHRESIVIDTHNDITTPMVDEGFDLGSRGDDPNSKIRTHTDIRRMKKGGVTAEFLAIYVDHLYIDKTPAQGGRAARRAMDMIDTVYKQVAKHSDRLQMAYTAADIRRAKTQGKIGILMGIEGGHAIEDSLHALDIFYKLGVRYMTLTHTNTNDWADSCADIDDPKVKHHDGLTDFGKQVVLEMNRLGMMVDISHVADKTFYDAVAVSKAPIIASHSSCRAICNQPRNMTDDMLRALAKNGGVIMINFYDGFLDPNKVEFTKKEGAYENELFEKYPGDPATVEKEMNKWREANSPGETPLSLLIDHINHAVKVAGIDHVGLGSDFDGVPFNGLPVGMKDISMLPNITYELMKRGYSDRDIKKILGENFLRVMSRVEQVARELQAPKNPRLRGSNKGESKGRR